MILDRLKKFVEKLSGPVKIHSAGLRVRYVGLHPGFRGTGAYAKFDEHGNMLVQADGTLNSKNEPECIVNGTNYAIGWHRVRKSDWKLDA